MIVFAILCLIISIVILISYYISIPRCPHCGKKIHEIKVNKSWHVICPYCEKEIE